MKLFVIIFSSVVLLNAKSCGDKNGNALPPCIAQMIADYQSKPVQNPPAAIYQYQYNHQTVYYVVAPCCDQWSTLYDSACQIVCHPDGGITGSGDGKCTNFNSAKTGEKLIWKDDRASK
jgi:hypothetical protein